MHILKQIKWGIIFIVFAFSLMLPLMPVFGKVGFVDESVWVSKKEVIEGETLTIYAVIANGSDNQFQADAFFSNLSTGEVIGSSHQINLGAGGTSTVISNTWTPPAGIHTVTVKLINTSFQGDNTEVFTQSQVNVNVSSDRDSDNVPDDQENEQGTDPDNPDTDGDGLQDDTDPNPLSTDADGDGDPDNTDPSPTDPLVFTPPDTDGDGIPDEEDSDIDNDGLYNFEEEENGTDPTDVDSDNDGIADGQDQFPTDPSNQAGLPVSGDVSGNEGETDQSNQASRDTAQQNSQDEQAETAESDDAPQEDGQTSDSQEGRGEGSQASSNGEISSDQEGQVLGQREFADQENKNEGFQLQRIALIATLLLLGLLGLFILFFPIYIKSKGVKEDQGGNKKKNNKGLKSNMRMPFYAAFKRKKDKRTNDQDNEE